MGGEEVLAMDEEEEEPPKHESDDEPAPTVELTAQEKQDLFVNNDEVKDMTVANVTASYRRFSIPQDDEGFDNIEFLWKAKTDAEEYMSRWILNRRMQVRIDDIQPSEWFRQKQNNWLTTLQQWHAKHVEFK